MKFYKDTDHKYDIPGFIIGFILAVIVLVSCTGCGSTVPEQTPDTDSGAYTSATVDSSTEEPDISAAPAVETSEPAETEPVVTPEAAPTAEHYESAANADTKGLPSAQITADTVIDTGKYRAFDFRTHAEAGAGLDGTELPFELYYGLIADFDNSSVTFSAYSHLEDVKPAGAIFRRLSTMDQIVIDADINQPISVNLGNQANDLFAIIVVFDNDDSVALPVYVNDGIAYGVSMTSADTDRAAEYLAHGKDLETFAEEWNVTPEKSLYVDMESLPYPYYPLNDSERCDTDLWRALAHDIVPDDTLSDSVKAVMLHDWMTANLAYDRYMSTVLKTARANYYNDFSGKWFVYDTRTGVCRDFVNIYAIMCRELGIPCSSLASEKANHTWNIIWLNGRWWEVDLTFDIQRKVYGEDVTDISNADKTTRYNNFLTYWEHNYYSTVTDVGLNIQCKQFSLYSNEIGCPYHTK